MTWWQRVWAWWRPVGVLWRRETLDQLRDWRILAPIFGLTFLFPLIANFTARRMVAFTKEYGATVVAESLFPFLMLAVAFFPVSISLVVALESFAGERERGTIEPLLASPLEDAQLYWGKLLAVLTPPLAALYLGLSGYILVMGLRAGWWPSPKVLVSVVGLSTLRALLMVSGAVVISTQATSVRGANLLASVIIIPMALLLQAEGWLMFWRHYDALALVALGMVAVTLLLVRIGLAHFNREGLLGRELDTLNLRWLARQWWRGFTGGAPSFKAWLVRSWRLAWLEQVWALLAVGVLMGLGLYLGYRLGQKVPPLHSATPRVRAVLTSLLQPLVPVEAPVTGRNLALLAYLFAYNTRNLGLALIGSVFTLGILGVLLPVITAGFLGFGMALVTNLGLTSAAGYWLAGVLPHGVVELPAMALFGAVTLRMGVRWITPSHGRPLGEVWLTALGEAVRLWVAVILPLFLIAAALESFVTPWAVMHFLLGH